MKPHILVKMLKTGCAYVFLDVAAQCSVSLIQTADLRHNTECGSGRLTHRLVPKTDARGSNKNEIECNQTDTDFFFRWAFFLCD